MTIASPESRENSLLDDLNMVTDSSAAKWFICANGKTGGPFETEKIRELLATGKIKERAFVKRDAIDTDWEETATVPWFSTIVELPVACYCISCDARLHVTTESSRQKVRCPECGHRALLINYLDEDSQLFDEIPLEPWGTYDIPVFAAGGLLLLIGLLGAAALLFNPSLSVLLGFIFLVFAAGLFGVTFHHRAQSARHRTHIRRVERALTERSVELVRLKDEINGIKRSVKQARAFAIRDAEDQVALMQKRVKETNEASRRQVEMTAAMAARFLDETQKWWTGKLTGQNYQITKDRISKAIEFVRKLGHNVPQEKEKQMFLQLQDDYENVLRNEHEKAEQRRIKEQMREELRIERENKRALERIEAEQRAIETALNEALRKAGDQHSAEVERLKNLLKEAEERGQRAKSQAQLTKVGYVYVISNIGSFGENTFKVGLTRRLEPQDRVKELGDASVPFPFDVHMMIYSDDAPALERTMHLALHRYRVNRANFRKEFFRTDIETIHSLVTKHHGIVEYKSDPEALEYRQTLNISDEDFDFLQKANLAADMDEEDDDLDGADD